MFDLGIQELIVIFAVALLVFGPKRLPELGKSIGRGLRELKRAMYDIKAEVNSELYDIDKIAQAEREEKKPESPSGPNKPDEIEEESGEKKGPKKENNEA